LTIWNYLGKYAKISKREAEKNGKISCKRRKYVI